MPKSASTISNQPAQGSFIDLEQAGGTLGIEAWTALRNCRFTDIGTVTRRDGLLSPHLPMDSSAGPLLAEAPSDYAIGGLYHFRVTHNVPGSESNIYVAKVNDFLVASQFGLSYDIPVGKGLGGAHHQAYFAEAYVDAELKRYLIVGSSNPQFGISYWDGIVVSQGAAYDQDKWGYLTRISWVPVGYQFAVEHGQRLYVAGVGTKVLYSQSGNFKQSAGQFDLEPRWGRVTGFLPTYYGELIIGQEKAITKVLFDGSGIAYAGETITTEYGLIGPNAQAGLGNDIIFMNTKGQITTVATTDRFGSLETGLLSAPVFRRFDDLPRSAWHHVWIEDDPSESTLWIGHCRRSGVKNDSLTGWNYKVNKFEPVENVTLRGPSCGAVMTLPRYNTPKLFMGTYALDDPTSIDPDVAGRIFTFVRSHKEDAILTDRTEIDGSADESYGDSGRMFLPEYNPIGRSSGLTLASFVFAGSYIIGPAKTTIIVRIKDSGTIGSGTIAGEVYDMAGGYRGTLNQAIGTGYGGGSFNVQTGGNHSGFTMRIPTGTVVLAGEEVFIHVHNARKVVEDWNTYLPDLQEGLVISSKSSGSSLNFVSYSETSPLVFGDPHQKIRVDGITVITRVTGNRADTVSNDPDNHASQNQYRHMVDVYVKIDKDPKLNHLAILDGNSAQRPHLDVSQSESAGEVPDRKTPAGLLSLQHVLSADGTEASGTPMASDADINVEYVPVNRTGKVFTFRFGQETMASLDHGVVSNPALGIRNGDFEIVGIHVHATPTGESAQYMDDGSLSVRVA